MSEPTAPIPGQTPIPAPTPATTPDPAPAAAAAPVAPFTPGPVSPAPTASHSKVLFIILPIVLMVLSLGGIAATLIYAHHEATVAPSSGSGRFPGGTYTGTRPTNFPNRSSYPSGFPTGGNYPSGFPTDGSYPSGFPTDMPSGMPTGGNGGGTGAGNGNFQRTPGQRPTGGNFGNFGNFPGTQANATNGAMKLSGLQIGLIVGCGVIFVGSAVFLIMSVLGRPKTSGTPTPVVPVGGAPGWQPPQTSAPAQPAQTQPVQTGDGLGAPASMPDSRYAPPAAPDGSTSGGAPDSHIA